MSASADQYQLVLTTAGSEEQARTIGRELVERRLAACVTIVTGCCSIFRWSGEISEEEEKLLIVKTRRDLFDQVREAIHELHSYELPEILALPIRDGDPGYLAWLGESLGEAPAEG